ncbi:hypothetical protein [Burkholderia gladioli]|nr:hypothetical protein [Burkholderia gladioli]
MSLLLCHLKVLPEALQAATEAQDALMIAHSRSHAVKRWIIPDELFEIICRALTAYDRQLAVASQAQIIAADCELDRLQTAAYPNSPDIGSTTPADHD